MPLTPGETLGRYVIDGVIGHGGMGSVYRAHDTRLQRQVALKVLSEEGATRSGLSTTGVAARILREARIAAKLEHPNVVAIYDVDEVKTGEHAGLAWLAMELIEGRPLRAYVGDRSVPLETRIRWLTEAARGLAAAHERGLVHRDVKPENVMVRADGVAKVLDFGVAKELPEAALVVLASRSRPAGEPAHAATVTGDGLVLGTPYYMSPEQMKGDAVDARADQFSWGVVAYELLAGVPPWGTDYTPIRVVAAVLGAQPATAPLREAEVPDRVIAVVLRTLAKGTNERFASMNDVVAALARGDDGTTGDATTPRNPRARRSLWLGTGAFAAVASALAVAWLARSRGHDAPAPLPVASVAPRDAADACTSNAACSRSVGAPAICAQGKCVALASTDCHVLANDNALADDSTFWIGSMYPLTGSAAADGAMNELATDLGRQDFADAANGLNASGTPVRPIGVVSCDSAADSTRAALHLVDELHLPAVVGFPDGADLIRLASSLFAPRHVLALTTLSPNILITQLPRPAGEPPLVWRTSFNTADAARAVAAFIETVIEPQLRAEGSSVTRITLLRRKAPGLLAASEALFEDLHFNGHTALENAGRFQEIVLDQTADPEVETRTVLSKLRESEPNVVIYSGDSFVKPVLEPFEHALPHDRGARPRYITMIALAGPALGMIGNDAGLRKRNFGITLPSTTESNGRFTLHFNGAFGKHQSRADAPGSAYDGFYLLAYAAMSLGAQPITGPSLAQAMAKLVPPGSPVEVGPAGIFGAFNRFRAGESIDLVGAASSLDLDVRTGDNPSDLSILCADVDKRGNAVGATESGVIYSALTRRLRGTMSCP